MSPRLGQVQVARSQGNAFLDLQPSCSGRKRRQSKAFRPSARGLYAPKCYPDLNQAYEVNYWQKNDLRRKTVWDSGLASVRKFSKRRNRKARGVGPEKTGSEKPMVLEPRRGDIMCCGIRVCVARSGLGFRHFRSLTWSWG
jgi:hypothetical protein